MKQWIITKIMRLMGYQHLHSNKDKIQIFIGKELKGAGPRTLVISFEVDDIHPFKGDISSIKY